MNFAALAMTANAKAPKAAFILEDALLGSRLSLAAVTMSIANKTLAMLMPVIHNSYRNPMTTSIACYLPVASQTHMPKPIKPRSGMYAKSNEIKTIVPKNFKICSSMMVLLAEFACIELAFMSKHYAFLIVFTTSTIF